MQLILVTIFSVASFLLGLMVISKHIKNATRLLFSILSFSIGLWIVVNYLSILYLREEIGLFLVRLVMGLAVIQSVTFFLFIHTFPNSYIKLKKKRFILLVVVAILTFIISLSPLLFTHLEFKDGETSPVPGPGMILFILVAIGSLAYGFILLIVKTRHAKGLLKTQLRYVLFGFLFMFLLILLFNFILVVIFNNSSFVQFAPFFTMTFVAFTTYAIVKYRLMDIKFVLRKGIVHALSLVIMLALYTYLVLALQEYFRADKIAVTLGAMGLVLITFYPLRKWLFEVIDNLFYRREIEESQRISNLIDKITQSCHLEDIFRNIVNIIETSLKIKEIKILLFNPQTKEYELEYPEKEKGIIKLKEDNPLIKYLGEDKESLIREELNFLISADGVSRVQKLGPVEKEIKKLDSDLIVPLGDERLLGLILLGSKEDQSAFTVQDIRFFKDLAQKAGLSLGNALMYKEAVERIKQEV